jgi:glycosyltransferase involved in cell wall biosynthesis
LFRSISNSIADAVNALIAQKGLEILEMEETHGWANTVIHRCPIPVIVRLCGPWFAVRDTLPRENMSPENRHRVEREGIAIRNAAGVTSPSDHILIRSEKYYGPINCPKKTIRRPIEVKALAERWALDTCDQNLILFVGRFDRLKGADILINSFAAIARNRPAATLVFVGPDSGLIDDSGRHINFQDYVDQEVAEALRGRIRYVGPLSRTEIERLRRTAYVTVVCSRYESFPNVVVETMAAGCPLVATDVGGIPELVVNQRNGLLVPANDVDALAAAMEKMFDDPDLAVRLGAQAALDCSSSCDSDRVARETVELYSTVIQTSAKNERVPHSY